MFGLPNLLFERPSGWEASPLSVSEMSIPFVHRNGRRFLRETREASSYPLPVDLAELHRQNLRTLMLMQGFGTPFCSTFDDPPKRVLEIACGSALWSSSCHEYFKTQGHNSVSFTGLDIVCLAPDLKKQGVNWRFVQHDIRRRPLPFKDGEFDLIFVNDGMAIIAAGADVPINPLTSFKRYLRPGGVVEVWETDSIFRCLLPEPPKAPGTAAEDADQAEKTATYTISAFTPFTKAQNVYIQDYNVWAEKALQKLGLTVTPCAVMGFSVSSESDAYEDIGSRRIAIPFSRIRWESDDISSKGRGKADSEETSAIKKHKTLTSDQAALRRTALNITVGLIESLEPLLMEESGKKQDEWDRWWGNMTNDLLEKDGTVNGECLEAGAWWARKM